MARFVHLHRFTGRGGPTRIDVISDDEVIANGRRWDLRTGARGALFDGVAASRDGRFIRFGERGYTDTKTPLEIVHADGRVVRVMSVSAYDTAEFVGGHAVLEIDRKPPVVVATEDGSVMGALPKSAQHVGRFNPHDGRTLWCNETRAIVQYNVATQTPLRRIEAPRAHVFVGVCVTPSGFVATWQRPAAQHENFISDDDVLVVFDAANARRAERPRGGMSFAPLGDALLVSHNVEKKFVVYDLATLEPRDVVPMFQPDRYGHNAVTALPSGRGWIAIGGNGPWDHYGEGAPSTATVKKAATKKAATKKAATKKAATKKAATKKAATKK